MDKSSRLPGFYGLGIQERSARIADWAELNDEDRATLAAGGLAADRADQMIENVVGTHALPLGMAANFLINALDHFY